ncbi:MAG: hypothetical protein FWC66_10235 [Oscillospiraceae bacterium]|nr:hypothetical protein [Oscillospiraceae bacterium]
MGSKMLGFALSVLVAVWLLVLAVDYLRQIRTPLIIIGGIILVAVVAYRIIQKRGRW